MEEEEIAETATEHRGHSSGRDTATRCRVISTTGSASPGCWSFDEQLVFRDPNILASRMLYEQILKRFLTFVAKRASLISDDAQVDVALTACSNAQHMFRAQRHRGNALMAAITHRYPRYSRHGWQATSIPFVSARLEIACP